jgi:hypothetical protein
VGISRPSFPPFTLNSAVDRLLKKEFDIHRAKGEAHPLMKKYGIDAVPLDHKDMDKWRENFVGVRFHHKPTNFIVFGAVDDIWRNSDNTLSVVDYKATSTNQEIVLEGGYKEAYKRQMEIYQWLLRNNGLPVSGTGYFVYCNGNTDNAAFDGRLEFDIQVIPYKGNDGWVEGEIIKAKKCLDSSSVPDASKECEYCSYVGKYNKAN